MTKPYSVDPAVETLGERFVSPDDKRFKPLCQAIQDCVEDFLYEDDPPADDTEVKP
jgi:hypothetical protein